MGRHFKLMLGGVLVALLLGFGATSQVDPVAGLAHQGELSVSVWRGVEPHVADTTVSPQLFPNMYNDFIHFSIDQQAYVYLLDIRPDGEVWLLLSHQLEPSEPGKPHNFPSDFVEQFTIPGPAGTHVIQALATIAPLDLGQEGRRVGTDPTAFLNGVELLIQRQGLGETGWAADWIRSDILNSLPFPPTPKGYLVIRVLEDVDEEEIPIPGAQVRTDGGDWEAVEQGVPRVMSVGEYTLQARALGLQPDPQTACAVAVEEKGNRGPEMTLDPCQPRITAKGQTVWVTFVLHRPGPVADFTWTPPEPCVGIEVTFDASISRPLSDIVEYEWDFGETGIDSQHRADPIIKWHFRQALTHAVTLTIHLRDGSTASKTHLVRAFAHGEPRKPVCVPANPILTFGDAEAEEREGGIKWMSVTNGYASILEDLSLPSEMAGTTVELSFDYAFESAPSGIASGTVEAFSFLSVVVNRVSVLNCFTLQPGEQPDDESGKALRTNDCGQFALPENYDEVRILAVTNVADRSGRSTEPLTVRYENVQLKDSNPDGPAADPLCQEAYLELDKQPSFYAKGEPITVRFYNECDSPAALKAWIIRDEERGTKIFSEPNALTVPPEGFAEWSWHQVDKRGDQVAECQIYKVELETESGSPAPRTFVIVPRFRRCF